MLKRSDYPLLNVEELEACERLASDPVVLVQLSVSDLEFTELALACSLAKNPAKPGKNWVTKTGGLPDFICKVARAIHRRGMPVGQAIAIAVSRARAWQHAKHPKPGTVAKSAGGAASWEAKKAEAHAMHGKSKTSASVSDPIDGGGAVSALEKVLAFAGAEPSEADLLWVDQLGLAGKSDDDKDSDDDDKGGDDKDSDDDDKDADDDVTDSPVYKKIVGKMGPAKAKAFVQNMQKRQSASSGKSSTTAGPLDRVLAFAGKPVPADDEADDAGQADDEDKAAMSARGIGFQGGGSIVAKTSGGNTSRVGKVQKTDAGHVGVADNGLKTDPQSTKAKAAVALHDAVNGKPKGGK